MERSSSRESEVMCVGRGRVLSSSLRAACPRVVTMATSMGDGKRMVELVNAESVSSGFG